MPNTKFSAVCTLCFSCLFILFSCSGAGPCENEVLGSCNFTINYPGGIVNLTGGSTDNARTKKLSDIEQDIILLESKAVVTDGGTTTVGFKFSYNMQEKSVVDIEELYYGFDTIVYYEKDLLEITLDIDSLNYELTNFSGNLNGRVMHTDTSSIWVDLNLVETPVCFN